jgi:hypothetical protein
MAQDLLFLFTEADWNRSAIVAGRPVYMWVLLRPPWEKMTYDNSN